MSTETTLATPLSGVPATEKITAAGAPDSGMQRPCPATASKASTIPLTSKTAADKHRKADFVNHLVDAATQVIESVWPVPPPTANCTKLLPLRLFVQEVLRRSRTSYVTLQTALFYLTLVQNHSRRHSTISTSAKSTEGYSMLAAAGVSSLSSTQIDVALSTACVEVNENCHGIITPPNSQRGCSPTTVPDIAHQSTIALHPTATQRHKSVAEHATLSRTSTLSTTPSLSSSDPRQCGRRMFLASLVIATKYLQDRAYSNRAWSRVSGLPASEITRCERKLLQWLNWDLYIPREDFSKWQAELLERVQAASGNANAAKTLHASSTHTSIPVPGSRSSLSSQTTTTSAKTPMSTTSGHVGHRLVNQRFSDPVNKDTLLRALSVTSHPPQEDCIPMSPCTPNPYNVSNYGRPPSYASPNLSPLSNIIHPSDNTSRKRLRSLEACEETLQEVLTRRPRTINSNE